jgi:hypothetical protein
MIRLPKIVAFSAVIILSGLTLGMSQQPIPEVMTTGTLREQMDFLNEKTRVYDNFRAIREDYFQLIRRNSVDSVQKANNEILSLKMTKSILDNRIDTLTKNLSETNEKLEAAIESKNSIEVIGIEIDKKFYNSIMWIIIAVLLILLGAGFLIFKKNLLTTISTNKELSNLKAEFEDYRQKKRLEKEKLEMDHFNEIKKLKGL